MCDIYLPVVTPAFVIYCERVEYSLTYPRFTSFNMPSNPVRLVYAKRTASIQLLILRHIWCTLWSEKYGK